MPFAFETLLGGNIYFLHVIVTPNAIPVSFLGRAEGIRLSYLFVEVHL